MTLPLAEQRYGRPPRPLPARLAQRLTRAYGRGGLVRQPGICERCGTDHKLASYDAREWFRMGPLPLVPLGAYRVLADCRACGWQHWVPLATYRAWAAERLAQTTATGQARAQLLYELGLPWAALVELAPLRAGAPAAARAAAHHLAGACWRAAGRRAEAIAAYEQAVAADDEQAAYHLDLSLALLARRTRGDAAWPRAARMLRRACHLAPADPAPWRALARAAAARGDWGRAAGAWRALINLDPTYATDPACQRALDRAARLTDRPGAERDG